ncbi:endoglucanase 12-like protein, partial [Tanacetum coccineum]
MGAMVGGPDRFDKFQDERSNSSYTEPTLAGNAGLVAALVLLIPGNGIDQKSIMSEIPSLYLLVPPPPQNPNRFGMHYGDCICLCFMAFSCCFGRALSCKNL